MPITTTSLQQLQLRKNLAAGAQIIAGSKQLQELIAHNQLIQHLTKSAA